MGWIVHTRIERWGLHLKIRARAENTRPGGWFLFFFVCWVALEEFWCVWGSELQLILCEGSIINFEGHPGIGWGAGAWRYNMR